MGPASYKVSSHTSFGFKVKSTKSYVVHSGVFSDQIKDEAECGTVEAKHTHNKKNHQDLGVIEQRKPCKQCT